MFEDIETSAMIGSVVCITGIIVSHCVVRLTLPSHIKCFKVEHSEYSSVTSLPLSIDKHVSCCFSCDTCLRFGRYVSENCPTFESLLIHMDPTKSIYSYEKSPENVVNQN